MATDNSVSLARWQPGAQTVVGVDVVCLHPEHGGQNFTFHFAQEASQLKQIGILVPFCISIKQYHMCLPLGFSCGHP